MEWLADKIGRFCFLNDCVIFGLQCTKEILNFAPCEQASSY